MNKLEELKTRDSDRQKVEAWLDFIGEDDPECREEVFTHCKESIEARKYYVGRYETRSNLDRKPVPLRVPSIEPMITAKDRAAGQ